MKTRIIFTFIIFMSLIRLSKAQTASCNNPAMLSITSASVTKPKCNGGNDGSISLNVSGPSGSSYTYTLTGATPNPPAPFSGTTTSYSFNHLEAIGFYVLEVRTPVNPADPNSTYYSCVQIVSINPPPQLQVSTSSSSSPTCAQGNDGKASVSIANGTPPFQINWSDGGTGKTRDNLSKGNYTVTVTDANGCSASSSLSITDPPPIIITTSTTNLKCNGDKNGSASVSVSGGTPKYTYISSAGTGSDYSNLDPGTYSVTVTDSKKCTATSLFTITAPPALSPGTVTTTRVKCNGGSDGSATINAPIGGTPGYTYTLQSNGNTQQGSPAVFNNSSAGNDTVTVTDANSCSVKIPFNVPGPPPIELELDMKKDDCSSGVGSIKDNAFATGGNGGPYTYQYSANGSAFSPFTPPRDFSVTDGIKTAGDNVTIKITDKDGCSATTGSTIENLPRAVPYIRINRNPCIDDELGAITVDSVQKNASVPSYTFSLSPDTSSFNFISKPGTGINHESAAFDNLSSQGYIMKIEDGKPCGPYPVSSFYLWNGSSYDLISNAGVYTLYNGDGFDTVSATSHYAPDYAVMHVINPNPITAHTISYGSIYDGATGTIYVYDITGGTPKKINGKPVYQLAIDDPANMQYSIPKDTTFNEGPVHLYTKLSDLAPGLHTLYIKDSLGCMQTIKIEVSKNFFIPNLITKNGDGRNDTFEILSLPEHSILTVSNKWGARVYYNTNYDNTFNGSGLSDDVYYYELELTSGAKYKGWVQIVE